jgi:hypothetical protein
MLKAKGKTEQVTESKDFPSKAMQVVFRIDPILKVHISIISVGFALLLDTWEFPPVEKKGVKSIRVTLTADDKEALDYLVRWSGKSAAEVVAAALIRAKNSKVRPHEPALRRGVARQPVKTAQEA